jgi:hypothetical protein
VTRTMRPTDEGAFREMLRWRGIETECHVCHGTGSKLYGSTSTWRGGVGGCSMTWGVCDHCWGSGDEHEKWANLRSLESKRADWENEQCLSYFARKTGASLSTVRRYLTAVADILEREERRRKTPFDHESSGFHWRSTLMIVAGAIRSVCGDDAARKEGV